MRMKIVLAVLAVTAILNSDYFAAAECPIGENPFRETNCGSKAETVKCNGGEYDCDWPESDCDAEVSGITYYVEQCIPSRAANCDTCWEIGKCWSSQKCSTRSMCTWDPILEKCVAGSTGVDDYVGDAIAGSNRFPDGTPCCTSADVSKIKTGVLAQTSTR